LHGVSCTGWHSVGQPSLRAMPYHMMQDVSSVNLLALDQAITPANACRQRWLEVPAPLLHRRLPPCAAPRSFKGSHNSHPTARYGRSPWHRTLSSTLRPLQHAKKKTLLTTAAWPSTVCAHVVMNSVDAVVTRSARNRLQRCAVRLRRDVIRSFVDDQRKSLPKRSHQRCRLLLDG
jgi:hypothetical protein